MARMILSARCQTPYDKHKVERGMFVSGVCVSEWQAQQHALARS